MTPDEVASLRVGDIVRKGMETYVVFDDTAEYISACGKWIVKQIDGCVRPLMADDDDIDMFCVVSRVTTRDRCESGG